MVIPLITPQLWLMWICLDSFLWLGTSQYRNAVASGQSRAYNILRLLMTVDPTLPRYGTDPIQASNECP